MTLQIVIIISLLELVTTELASGSGSMLMSHFVPELILTFIDIKRPVIWHS